MNALLLTRHCRPVYVPSHDIENAVSETSPIDPVRSALLRQREVIGLGAILYVPLSEKLTWCHSAPRLSRVS